MSTWNLTTPALGEESNPTWRLDVEEITRRMRQLEDDATLHAVIQWLRENGWRVEKDA